jgi:hypothetical protein
MEAARTLPTLGLEEELTEYDARLERREVPL